jgi:5-methylcytosine-specific restriction endonuclease McrA
MTKRDSRYGTAPWKKLRRQVLAEAGGVCEIQGPRCTGIATTVDHVVPSSQWPDGFWQRENPRASCPRCNFSGGAALAAESRRREQAKLYDLIWRQQSEIDSLRARLARYEDANGARRARKPAIR